MKHIPQSARHHTIPNKSLTVLGRAGSSRLPVGFSQEYMWVSDHDWEIYTPLHLTYCLVFSM